MEQLGGQDASFLYFETPATHMHIASVALYDQSSAPGGRVRFRDLVDNVRKRLHLAKCFRRRVVEVPLQLDHPYWLEDRHFDLEYHVRHIALPPPGDWRQLCRQSARLHSFPLDRAHPLWEMTVISGLKRIPEAPEGAFAVSLKIHHAAIDGVTGEVGAVLLVEQHAVFQRLPDVGDWRQGIVVHLDGLEGVLGQIAAFGHHDRNWLTHVSHLVAGQVVLQKVFQARKMEHPYGDGFCHGGDVVEGVDAVDAGQI